MQRTRIKELKKRQKWEPPQFNILNVEQHTDSNSLPLSHEATNFHTSS